MYRGTEALVLKAFDLREADQILTVFSRDLGKIPVVAKGVKKPQSSLRGMVQPFCMSQFYLTRSGEMYLMTQGKIIRFFGNIREDLDKTLQALYILELLDKSLADYDPHPRLFKLTAEVFNYLEDNPASLILLNFFEIHLLNMLGFSPVLHRCSNCGQTEDLSFFSSSSGGVVCGRCAPSLKADAIMPAVQAVLNTLSRSGINILPRLRITSAVQKQVERVLEGYLEYYLERKLNLKNVMRTLKGFSNGKDN
ncbi:MAG: DNA repair protein RecO [Syntrophomonadaceae bacterium]|nr:DNA repair protein RecO [Syntrophomonadaceae bacterium]